MAAEDSKRQRTSLTEADKTWECECKPELQTATANDVTRVYLDGEGEDELLLLEAEPALSAALRRAFADTYRDDPEEHINMVDIFSIPIYCRKSITYTPEKPYVPKRYPNEEPKNPLLERIPDLNSHTYTITRIELGDCHLTQSFFLPCYNWH